MNSLRIERASWYDTKSTKVQKYKKLEKKYYKKAYEKAQKFKIIICMINIILKSVKQ